MENPGENHKLSERSLTMVIKKVVQGQGWGTGAKISSLMLN